MAASPSASGLLGELKGYGQGDALPPYRTIPAILVLDGATMTHRVTGQQISPTSLPDIAHDLIKEEVPLYGPIAELTDAIRNARNQGESHLDFGIPAGSALTALTNHHLRVKGVQYQTIERIYWRAAVTSLVGVVDTVQTNLVEIGGRVTSRCRPGRRSARQGSYGQGGEYRHLRRQKPS